MEIELPDGTIAEFPDGTSHEVIKSALRKRFGGGQSSTQNMGGESWTPGQAEPQAQQPMQPSQSFGSMAPQEQTMGGRVFDTLKSMGLPADRMRGDLQTVDDLVRGTANGLTFGVADRLAGAAYGTGTDAQRALSEQAQQRSPIAYTGGEIAGAVGGIGKLQGMGLTAGKFLQQGAGILPRMGASVVDSLAINELLNAGYGRDPGTGMGTAAVVGAGAPVVGDIASASASKVAGAFNKAPKVPSGAELKQAGRDALKIANDQGVMFTPQGMQRLRANVVDDLTEFGYHPGNQPGAAIGMDELNRLADQNVTLQGLHSARKLVSKGYNAANPSNNEALNRITTQIDDLIANPQAGDVIEPSALAASEFGKFKDLYHRGSKLQTVEDLVENARLNAGATGSGGNVDNATRQKLKTLLTNPKAGRGFSPDEKAAIEKVVMGTPTQNALRLAGKLSPQGNGLMAALGIGGTMVNPTVGAVALGGMGAKAIADKITTKNVDKLTKLIAAGGKASAMQAPKNAAQMAIESKKDMIARMLMGGGLTMAPLN